MKRVALALALVSAVAVTACEQHKPPLMPDTAESIVGFDGGAVAPEPEPVVPAPAK